MSRPNAKTPTTAQGAPEAPTGPADTAVVQPAPAAAPQAPPEPAVPDEHRGRGGLYTVANGVRQRVGGTKQSPEQSAEQKD